MDVPLGFALLPYEISAPSRSSLYQIVEPLTDIGKGVFASSETLTRFFTALLKRIPELASSTVTQFVFDGEIATLGPCQSRRLYQQVPLLT
jgi:hypothetical protein